MAKCSIVWPAKVIQLIEKSVDNPIFVGSGPARSSIAWPATTAQLVGKSTKIQT